MMNNYHPDMYELLLRSLDEELSPTEQHKLQIGLQENEALRTAQQQLLAARALLAGQEFDFKSGFEERVMTSVRKLEAEKGKTYSFDSSLLLAFKRVAVSGIAAILILLAMTYYQHQSLSINAITGLNKLDPEDLTFYYTIDL